MRPTSFGASGPCHWNDRDYARIEGTEIAIKMLGYGQKIGIGGWQ
jgi:hypothetical protein